MNPGQWYDPKKPPTKQRGGWSGDEAEVRARRAGHVRHAIALGWKKKCNGTDIAISGEWTFKQRWDYAFRGLYLGNLDEYGVATFYRDLALTEQYGKVQMTDDEVQILALLAMREYPEIIQEW